MMTVIEWLERHGVRKGYAWWLCEHCLRHHSEKWTRIEHGAECPNSDPVRQRYREVEGKRNG